MLTRTRQPGQPSPLRQLHLCRKAHDQTPGPPEALHAFGVRRRRCNELPHPPRPHPKGNSKPTRARKHYLAHHKVTVHRLQFERTSTHNYHCTRTRSSQRIKIVENKAQKSITHNRELKHAKRPRSYRSAMANIIEKGLRMCLELVWVWRRDLESGVASPLYDLFLRLEVCLLGTPKSTPGHEQLVRPRPPHARPATRTAARIQTPVFRKKLIERLLELANPDTQPEKCSSNSPPKTRTRSTTHGFA